MAKETNIRFVRCPRCREILPELADHPLYRCGNCDTVIQAKSRRTRRVEWESDSANTSLQKSVLDVKEVRSSLDKDPLGGNCEVLSMSEGPTSPDIATCSREGNSSIADDESLKQKGKSKLTGEDDGEDQGVCEATKITLESGNQESLLLAPETDDTNENHFSDSNREFIMDGGSTSDPVVPPDSPLSESHVSLYLTSPDQECPDYSPYNDAPSFTRNGLSAISPVTDLSSEPDLKPESISMYPAAASYYGYDGSESSCDGIDDHKLNKVSRPSRKPKDPDYMITRKRFSETGFKPKSSVNPERYTGMNRCTGGDGINQGKLRNISALQSASKDPLDASGRLHGFNSSEKLTDSESDKLDLLRTVWELKDQLNKMHFSKTQINTRFPVQHEDLTPFGDYGEHHHLSRNAFSRESALCGNQVGCSCLHCHSGDLHCSAQLPLHYKKSHHFVHSDHNCRDSSCSTSQQHHTRQILSRWRETDENPAKEVRLNKISQTMMKHTLPVAGGAPFIACYYCGNLLQLPAELVIFRRRYHNFLCGACKKILRFSLHKGAHLEQYTEIAEPPPCEVDGAGSEKNHKPDPPLGSCSQVVELKSALRADGFSSRKSCSTEPKIPERKGTISGVYIEGIEGGKKPLFKKSWIKKHNLMEDPNCVASSYEKANRRKEASDSVEEPASSTSPLHHLMGYSSVSQIFRS